eukprot:1358927-Pyramimonas_sp.AAC.1
MSAPPRSPFSLARNRRPVRHAERPEGLLQLREKGVATVIFGNLCTRVAVYIVSPRLLHFVPCALENLMISQMWRCRDTRQEALPHSWAVDLHQCSFGSRWRESDSSCSRLRDGVWGPLVGVPGPFDMSWEA